MAGRGAAQTAGQPHGPARATVTSSTDSALAPVFGGGDDDAVIRAVADYYHATLRTSDEALQYLARRGIAGDEAIDRFRLGYGNRTLGLLLPVKQLVLGRQSRERLQRLGFLRESGHEHFHGSLVIPITDGEGRIVQMYGRKTRDDLRPGTPKHTYLPGQLRGVWNDDGLNGQEEVILCEALIDGLTFWCHGFRNVTATCGVDGFGADHLAAFHRQGVRRILIAFDRDEAGEKAAERVSTRLREEGFDAHRARFPKGMDANKFAVQDLDTAMERLGTVIDHSRSLPAARAARVDRTGQEEAGSAEAAGAGERVESEAPLSADELLEATAPPSPLVPPEVRDGEVIVQRGDREWRIRGLANNTSYDLLKVTARVSRSGGRFHVDTLDLYSARQRAAFIRQAAHELGVSSDTVKSDLGKLLLQLEALVDEQMRRLLEPPYQTVELTDEERESALALLHSPSLLDRILEDFERCGIVGEETNKLVAYLAATSRKLDRPLAVVVQSSSAAGKSTMLDAVLDLIPEEERAKYSAMTAQSLYYMAQGDLL